MFGKDSKASSRGGKLDGGRKEGPQLCPDGRLSAGGTGGGPLEVRHPMGLVRRAYLASCGCS